MNQTSTVTDMHPGDDPQTLSGNFTNNSTGPVYVGKVTASIASVVPTYDSATPTCTANDYTLTTPEMSVDREVAVGTGVGAWTGATIRFNNTDANQDNCKGATVNLAYTVS